MVVSVNVVGGLMGSIDDIALCNTLLGDLECDLYELARLDDLERILLIIYTKRGLDVMREAEQGIQAQMTDAQASHIIMFATEATERSIYRAEYEGAKVKGTHFRSRTQSRL